MAYPRVEQEMDLWCWAAVSVSVDKYFDAQSGLRQCDVAGEVLPGRNCCGDKASCNSAESLTTALERINRLERRLDYPIDFAAVMAQIDAEFPVCVRIEWFGGSAHFVAVSAGWTSGGREVLVIEDPSYGRKTVFYDSFPSEYEGGGDWTHTYLTK